jgi:hypothetical protein
MLPLLVLFASGIVVKQDQAQLRTGCASTDAVVAAVSSGSAAQVLFSMNGDSETCYKVLVSSGTRSIEGYLPASALDGLDTFRRAVETAPAVILSPSKPESRIDTRQQSTAASISGNPLSQANKLIETNQPAAALALLERTMKTSGRDYPSLVAAGVAAYKSDEPQAAIAYLREAEQLHEDHAVKHLIARIEKEKTGDKSAEKLYGTRFLLRYEGGHLAPDVARGMVSLLEQEFSRISGHVGCRTDERIVTIVQSQQAYRDTVNAAEWSGGIFDGSKIRVPVVETTAIEPLTRRALSHELVHACLANLGAWPMWLHEGLAQKLSGDTVSPARRAQVKTMVQAGQLPRLNNMNQSWSRMSSQHARRAYDYALVAVELMYETYRDYGIHNIFRNPDRLAQITADLDNRLAQQ